MQSVSDYLGLYWS